MKLANPPERWLCLDGGWNSPCRQNVFCAGNFSPYPAYMNDGELLTPFWSLAALSPWCISLSLTLMYQTGSLTALLGWLNKAPLNPHFPIVSWLDFSFLSSLTRPLPSGSTLVSWALFPVITQVSCKAAWLCVHHVWRSRHFADKIQILLMT